MQSDGRQADEQVSRLDAPAIDKARPIHDTNDEPCDVVFPSL